MKRHSWLTLCYCERLSGGHDNDWYWLADGDARNAPQVSGGKTGLSAVYHGEATAAFANPVEPISNV
jgi:hypothetical protein